MTQKKKTKPSKSQSQNNQKFQTLYLVMGIFIAFLSLIALFNWGMIGVMLTNGFRLIVGQAHNLVLFAIFCLGLLMMVKGNLVIINFRRLLGACLVLVAVTGTLHLTTFYNYLQDNPNLSVFDHVFHLYRSELLTQQTISSLGGGMLGAGLYSTVSVLFGKWGSYLFYFALFNIGLVALINVTMVGGWQAIQVVLSKLYGALAQIFPSLSKLNQVFQEGRQAALAKREERKQTQSVDQEHPSVNELELDFDQGQSAVKIETFQDRNVDKEVEVISESAQISSPQPLPQAKSTNRILNFFQNLFFGNDEEPYYQIPQQASHPYMPTLEREEEPVYQPQEDYEFVPYREGDPQAQTAQIRRAQFDEAKVLDLDFFDQMQVSHNDENHSQEKVAQAESKLENSIKKAETVRSDKAGKAALPEKVNQDFDPFAIEKSSTNNSNDEASIKEGNQTTASHWQESSNQKQALTDDGVDKLLQAEHSQKKKQAQKSKNKAYQFPGKDLLNKVKPVDQSEEYKRINENIKKLEVTFESFGVDAKIVKANLGPSVTKYEIEPAIGVKVSKIVSLSDDIALALAARDIRMEAPIPGKSLIGIEVPNTQVSPVVFSEIVDAALESKNPLEVPLGRDISGSVCMADLTKMPHLLIAGATGSGKSVGVNVIICSILMKAKPEEMKFLMIDPKKVELTLYNDLPHQLSPVVTNPRKAARALNNVVEEMERRYELFATTGVRNVDGYNEQVDQWNQQEGTGYQRLPKIVVIVDELADLMMVASSDVENAIIRLAQMARAAGIHMIIATQRPSVDVITGIIKANIPSRLAFAVSSGTDSRTILDANGAEKLLGRGDMLFQPMGKNKPVRVQGAYISDEEVERITDFIKDQREADYDENIVVSEESSDLANASDDEYFGDAVEMISDQETVSISQLQRRFRIGYNRAARLIDDLEAQGLVSGQDGSKPRQVLIDQTDE